MAESFATFRDGSGGMRFRSVKAGHDPRNLALDRRLVTFDSKWTNSFRVRANGVASGAALGAGYTTMSGGLAYRQSKVLPFSGSGPDRPTLAWQRNNGGALNGGAIFYARGYGVCGVSMTNSQIHISPARNTVDYVYYVFTVNPQAEEASGAGGIFLGRHPLYGTGLYIGRPAVDPRTASLDDMMLTTQRNHFQIAETKQTSAAHDTIVTDDPFPFTSPNQSSPHSRRGFTVNLNGWYPDYPPVIAYSTDMDPSDPSFQIKYSHNCSVFWLSPNQILVVTSMSGGVRIGVVGSDPAYVPGPGAEVVRIAKIRGDGYYVTKKDIDFRVSGPNDYLFSSHRQTTRFTGFAPIIAGAPTGIYALPNPPTVGGIPFSFFMVYWNPETQWWCGCGMVLMQDAYRFTISGTNYYFGPAVVAANYTINTFKLYNNPTFSSGFFGSVATMNVSDF